MPEELNASENAQRNKLIEGLAACLSGPVIVAEKQAFGDDGDGLKPKFDAFVKELSDAKLLRDYLTELIIKKRFKKDSDVYKASGISRFVFSKIMRFTDPPHKPSQETVAALCIGLRLEIYEAEKLHNLAGFHLGYTEPIDRAIRFFIRERVYDIDEVNYCLHYCNRPPLGDKVRGDRGRKEK